METSLFKETQRFRQWWLWAILIGATGWELYSQFALELSNNHIIAPLLIILPVVILFTILRLETELTQEGIRYRFFPFHLKVREIKWEEVENVYTREYRPILEYGGWGIRLGFLNNRAFNVSGKQGLQLKLKNGKMILFGTREMEKVEEVLEQLRRKKVIE
jgi:hypothetical protein